MFNAQRFAQRLANRDDRWSLLKEFVADWHAPLKDGDGYPAEDIDDAERSLGLKLPLALREWYLMAGHREDLVAVHNWLVPPHELRVEDYAGTQALTFYSENQGVVYWGTPTADMGLDDPPVIVDETGLVYGRVDETGTVQNRSVSEFILQMILTETALFGRLSADGSFSPDMTYEHVIGLVRRQLVQLDLPVWSSYPLPLFVGDDLLCAVKGRALSVAARSLPALAHALEMFPIKWDVRRNGDLI